MSKLAFTELLYWCYYPTAYCAFHSILWYQFVALFITNDFLELTQLSMAIDFAEASSSNLNGALFLQCGHTCNRLDRHKACAHFIRGQISVLFVTATPTGRAST